MCQAFGKWLSVTLSLFRTTNSPTTFFWWIIMLSKKKKTNARFTEDRMKIKELRTSSTIWKISENRIYNVQNQNNKGFKTFKINPFKLKSNLNITLSKDVFYYLEEFAWCLRYLQCIYRPTSFELIWKCVFFFSFCLTESIFFIYYSYHMWKKFWRRLIGWFRGGSWNNTHDCNSIRWYKNSPCWIWLYHKWLLMKIVIVTVLANQKLFFPVDAAV